MGRDDVCGDGPRVCRKIRAARAMAFSLRAKGLVLQTRFQSVAPRPKRNFPEKFIDRALILY